MILQEDVDNDLKRRRWSRS